MHIKRIHTSFVQKGKRENDFVREYLARVRATTMEGSFGTQKEHFSMRRIKARMKLMWILYIFFGVYTANAVLLADRLEKKEQARWPDRMLQKDGSGFSYGNFWFRVENRREIRARKP